MKNIGLRVRKIGLLSGFICLIVSSWNCQTTQQDSSQPIENKGIEEKMTYAENFKIFTDENHTILTIKNPWKGADETFRYVTYQRGTTPPKGFDDAYLIPVPVQSIACLSTTHVALLDFLGATDNIVGISGSDFVYNENIQDRIATQQIRELGDESGLNYEVLLDTEPEIVLTYGIGGALNNIDKIEKLGLIPVVMAEYIDNSPLARAEWVRFLGVLLGKEVLAKDKFTTVANAYETLKLQVAKAEKPTAFMGTPYEGTWFMPGGQSFVGQYVADAGGDYLWKDSNLKGSLELDFEAVFEKAKAADYWMDLGMVTSVEQLNNMDSRFQNFNAFQTGQIYNYTARLSENGGYDIYESAVVNPHLVLSDFIKILHPSLLPDYELVYYERLK